MKIKAVKAYKVFDSNANPTVAVAIKHKRGINVGSAPAGTSVGKHEAESYRRDVELDVKFFNQKIAPSLAGFKFRRFEDLTKLEPKLTNVFAGPRIALEFALLKALARDEKEEIYKIINPSIKSLKFPTPLGKVIGGGAHSVGDIQEYLFAPKAKSFTEAAFINAELHKKIKSILEKKDKYFLKSRDLEGGWVSSLPATALLEICSDACRSMSQKLDYDIDFGIDLAASQLYQKQKYNWTNYSEKRKHLSLSPEKQIELIKNISNMYNITYLEDPLEEDDLAGFSILTDQMQDKIICADDFTCTNPNLLREVISHRAAKAVIVKPNQAGSLLKTKEFVDLAKGFGLKIIVSHRSGESTDSILSHLALGWQADYIKCGITGGERVSKINELIRLEHSD